MLAALYKALFIWVLLEPLTKLLISAWNFVTQLFELKTVDLKATFGEWAVITGSTDGIGKAYAMELAKRNLNLILISRTLQKLENTRSEIKMINPNIQVKIIVADFSKGKEIYEYIKKELFGVPVGILVNNVGVLNEYPMYLEEMASDEIWNIINVNIGATTLMTKMVMEMMKKEGKGAIVNVSSGSDSVPLPFMSVYAASKAFVKSFSDSIRLECSKSGITVQSLSPYYIDTNMIKPINEHIRISRMFIPNGKEYAKSAVKTLGIINSTTGYLMHEIVKFAIFLLPFWIRFPAIYYGNKRLRDDYLKSTNK